MYIYYTILYYTILYYTILYYTILYYTILYYTILYYTILYFLMWARPRQSVLARRSRLHPVSVTRFPSFRTQTLENLTPLPIKDRFLSNPDPGENLVMENLVMEAGCMGFCLKLGGVERNLYGTGNRDLVTVNGNILTSNLHSSCCGHSHPRKAADAPPPRCGAPQGARGGGAGGDAMLRTLRLWLMMQCSVRRAAEVHIALLVVYYRIVLSDSISCSIY